MRLLTPIEVEKTMYLYPIYLPRDLAQLIVPCGGETLVSVPLTVKGIQLLFLYTPSLGPEQAFALVFKEDAALTHIISVISHYRVIFPEWANARLKTNNDRTLRLPKTDPRYGRSEMYIELKNNAA